MLRSFCRVSWPVWPPPTRVGGGHRFAVLCYCRQLVSNIKPFHDAAGICLDIFAEFNYQDRDTALRGLNDPCGGWIARVREHLLFRRLRILQSRADTLGGCRFPLSVIDAGTFLRSRQEFSELQPQSSFTSAAVAGTGPGVGWGVSPLAIVAVSCARSSFGMVADDCCSPSNC